MQKTISRFGFFTLLLFIAGAVFTAQAQYLVSSKAGFVNRVEGKVHLKSQGTSLEGMNKASLGAQMKEGDRIVTDAESHAELLLTPGAYLRLNEKTEVEAVRTSLENTRFDVIQGSVILEVGELDKKVPLEIGTPRTVVSLNKAGIYRIDVVNGDVAVSVRRGEAFLGTREQLLSGSASKIGNNKVYRLVGNGAPQTTKLSSKVFDSFDEWSYLRAESLMAANYSVLQQSRSRNPLLSGWIYDPRLNTYTYVPSSWLLVTPYGFGFYRRYSDCEFCWGGGYPGYYGYGGGYYGGGNNSGGGNNNGGSVVSAPPRVNDIDRTGSRSQTSRTDVPSRHVEPYSRPSYSPSYSRSGDSDSSYSNSRISGGYDRSSSPTYSSPSPASSSPAPSAPSRVDSGGSSTGRGDSSRTVGGRGN